MSVGSDSTMVKGSGGGVRQACLVVEGEIAVGCCSLVGKRPDPGRGRDRP
jgi:hypothetical protein